MNAIANKTSLYSTTVVTVMILNLIPQTQITHLATYRLSTVLSICLTTTYIYQRFLISVNVSTIGIR